MVNYDILIQEAKQHEACKSGFISLKKAKTDKDLVSLFFENIDFCLAKNFPNTDVIKSFELTKEMNIFVSEEGEITNAEKLVLLENCNYKANYTDYSVARIYVKHNSVFTVNAKGNSFVMIDALDNAKIAVNASENAKVIVNLYANAICEGNAKVNVKNKVTYDL